MLPKKILLIQQDKVLSTFMARFLTKQGHAVLILNHGKNAQSVIHELQPDLIICDLLAPYFTTLALRHCAPETKGRRTPVIITSSLSNYGAKKEAGLLGADLYLSLPIDLLELNNQVRSLLSQPQLDQTPKKSVLC